MRLRASRFAIISNICPSSSQGRGMLPSRLWMTSASEKLLPKMGALQWTWVKRSAGRHAGGTGVRSNSFSELLLVADTGAEQLKD